MAKAFLDINDPLIVADLLSETIGGGTNAVAALGNGSLTAGISPWGEVVYHRWPNPSYYDHLRYVTDSKPLIQGLLKVSDARYADDAPCSDWKRYGRPYEKHPGTGARAGIRTKGGACHWLDSPVWISSRNYETDESHLLHTSLVSDTNCTDEKFSMKIAQWIMPDEDLFVQQFSARGASALLYHATYAPWMKKTSGIDNPDSSKAGFATIYLAEEDLIVWFYPQSQKIDHPDPLSIRTAAELDEACGSGIFIAMGADKEFAGLQTGADRYGRKASEGAPEGGRTSAEKGTLPGNTFYRGSSDVAVELTPSPKGYATLYTATASTARDAAVLIQNARAMTPEKLKLKALKSWQKTGKKVHLPDKARKTEKRVALRSVLNLLVGRDPVSGAIVASPARQPFYACDWPRDGAFYDMALDLAGFTGTVTDHLEFYRRTQRTSRCSFNKTWLASFKSPFYSARGHWYANMNTDGSPGFFKIIPVEIDETSLMVWDIWRHEQFIKKKEREIYRDRFSDTVRLAMEGILEYVDISKGWTKRVMEDDDYIARRTLHGVSSVLTGLASGTDIAARWEFDAETIQRWREATMALHSGIRRRITDPKYIESAGWRGIQWSLFPAPIFDGSQDPLMAPFVEKLKNDMDRKAIRREGGVGYLGEQLFTFAMATAGSKDYKKFNHDILKTLTSEVPVKGTDAFGELGLWVEMDGERFIQSRTSIPHLWNGITVYLSLIALYEPERISPLRPPLPAE